MALEPAMGALSVRAITQLAGTLSEIQTLLLKRGMRDLALAVAKILNSLLDDLNALAREFATVATTEIITKIHETAARNRPQTGEMETHIRSEPGPLGSVAVAVISDLDTIVNPGGYGAFWPAQEFGTGTAEVPSQEGRTIEGIFQPSGHGPDPSQRGLRVGHDQAFDSGAAGGKLGTISVELPARHFLRDGYAAAEEQYLARVAELNRRYAALLRGMMAQVKREAAAKSPARYRYRLEL